MVILGPDSQDIHAQEEASKMAAISGRLPVLL
jgi:hypothetical protein